MRRAWASRTASQVGRKRTGAGVSASGSGSAGEVEQLGAVLGREALRSVKRFSAGSTSLAVRPAQLAISALAAGPNPVR